MGSNLLLRYLCRENEPIVQSAVCISVPWDIYELSKEISKYSKFIYDFGITRNFKRNLRWNSEIFKKMET